MVSREEKLTLLGPRLKQRREELGLSIQGVAREVKISPHYITALEEGNWSALGAHVYASGFLKKILSLFAVEQTDAWLHDLQVEWDIWLAKKSRESPVLAGRPLHSPYLTPQRIFLGLGIGALVGLGVLMSTQLKNFTGSPNLFIDEPQDQILVEQSVITVKGHTDKESRLTVNGREITIDGSGNFNETIEVASGVSVLEFIVRNRFGKETKEVRNIVVR